MKSLLYLYSRLIVNEYKKKFFSKNTLFGALIIIFLSIFAIGMGFGLGYFVNYADAHKGLHLGNPFYFLKMFFSEIGFIVIVIKASPRTRLFGPINLGILKIFPLTKREIFLFDVNTGLFDYMSLYLTELILGLIAGAGGFSLSLYAATVFIILCFSLVYLIHIFSEFLHSITRLLSSLPKIRTTISILIIASIIYTFVLKDISINYLINNNPLSWNVGSVFSLIIFNEGHWLLNIIQFNIICSFAGIILIILIKSFHEKLFSAHIVQINKKIKNKRFQLPNLALFFPKKLQPYLEKDIKYILRSSRSLSTLIIELLVIVFVSYMHFTHSRSYNYVYFPAGFIILFPSIMWDFFLSNCWGFEKKGFGFYMFSNADTYSLTPSKNLSYMLVRLPLILLGTLALCIMFSFKFLPLIILLYIILALTTLSFSNLVSVKNPFPVNFKERSMSKQQQQKVSWIGFIGLISDLILPAATLFMVFKLGLGVVTYSVLAIMLILLLAIYKVMISYSSSFLIKQKEIIYKKLIKI